MEPEMCPVCASESIIDSNGKNICQRCFHEWITSEGILSEIKKLESRVEISERTIDVLRRCQNYLVDLEDPPGDLLWDIGQLLSKK